MATYAIGDVQGCFRTLNRLLKKIRFDPAEDRALLVGDLVNRGPRSLEVLRWARGLGDRVDTVLGNHDLHLIARHLDVAKARKRDTLDDVLDAKDADDLVGWLRERPFTIREGDYLFVHGGILPAWSLATAEELGRELSAELQGDGAEDLLERFEKDPPAPWREDLPRKHRLAVAAQALTRLRVCRVDGTPEAFSGPPAEAPPGTRPWLEFPERRWDDATVVFGHWAALGLHVGPRAICLDTGCVWGRELTAMRLEDREIVQVPLCD